ncbi:hypothetical protein COJ85_32760 [Bacillus sp. AFS076308]|uniref:DUF523 domain-containing protein n=1 Tax=unclassified Bacillus (in: firmicutes) TaxID=185979 RepID=UPI000BF3C0A9|nr:MULTISPECIES: DUF523 domain-containing protein [unclassified Bacillus (in: firmicutes)]PFN76437.1 hypothetical protein COJ85_32760 [Bacillus sp. AFS076308]PGV54832.1 hypothetical protein COD92_03745 [Bacillus sp. AFS037270]
MILVSSCLAGLEVRYNGSHCLDEKIHELIEKKQAITVCPELLGGLSTPREPAEIIGGNGGDVLDGKAKVVNQSGMDVTEQFVKGAYVTLRSAQELNATVVILKENSPSCGSSMIYNGEFKGEKIIGEGVTAALLRRNDIEVVSEKNLAEILGEKM